MFSPKQVKQYWPWVVVAVAIFSGVPAFLANPGNFSRSSSKADASQMSISSTTSELPEFSPTNSAGYIRPDGTLPFYGFDELSLSSPMFKSWWGGGLEAAVERLKGLRVNTVLLGPIWKDAKRYHDTVALLHNSGIQIIVEVTEVSDWVDAFEDKQGKLHLSPNTFVLGRAAHVLAQARRQDVGRFADFVVIGGDALAYASQLQRQKMYQMVKQYFPETPIIRRYGRDFEKSEGQASQVHPMGGKWEDYRFGADECDIALISIGRGIRDNQAGVKVSWALEHLNQTISVIKSRSPETGILVRARFGDDRDLNINKSAMWSPKEIDQFVSAVLTSPTVEGLLMRGMGHALYDLGNPEFVAEREAFKNAAPIDGFGVADIEQKNTAIVKATRGLASE